MFMLRAVCVLLFILALHESVDAEVYAPGHRPMPRRGMPRRNMLHIL